MKISERVISWCHNEKYIVEVVLILIAVFISLSGVLSRVDLMVFDVGQHITRWQTPNDIVIVAIDEDSLSRIGGWPWPRKTHAKLLEKLCAAKPAVIGFDIAFSEASQDPREDEALAQAIKKCSQVVLPMVIETVGSRGQVIESPPIQELLSYATGLGRAGVRMDEDGIVRSVFLREGVGSAAWPLFAEELLRVSGKYDISRFEEEIERGGFHIIQNGLRMIEFIGPPGSFASISYAQILNSDVPVSFFENKIVLVGATAIGLGDFLPTPMSALSYPMPGVEVQANILFSMKNNLLIKQLNAWQTTFISILLALVPMLWLPRLMPLPGLLTSLVWVIFLSLGCSILPHFIQTWFPPSGALVAGALAFPLWSWRRLESARKLLDNELLRLGSALSGQQHKSQKVQDMSFEQRIAWVQEAQDRMQKLEEQRSETLAFISHDLRSPLASVVVQLESAPQCDSALILPPLRRAQHMAQDFLQLARAQMLDASQMREQELVSVLHQAADEVFERMKLRDLKLVRSLPEDTVWVKGDFVAIERCTMNLLQNALTYAPSGTTVTLGLDVQKEAARFWIENEGEAFNEEQRSSLFLRFKAGEKGASNPESTGLGLYYVKTVADKHGGNVGVDCENGKIRFWVSLPREL